MKRPATGFTLAELMTTVAILGALLAVGIPAFRQLQEGFRTSAAFHELTASLSAARNSAVMRNETISVCPSRDGRRCREDRVWDDGWITFRERRGVKGNPTTADDVLLHTVPGFRGIAIRSTAGRHWVRFRPSGMSVGNNQSLWICVTRPPREVGRIALNDGGRVRSERHRQPTQCRYSP